MRSIPLFALLAGLLLPIGTRAQTAPLSAGDFLVAGLSASMDSAAVRRILGAPDSITSREHPFDPGAELYTLHYADLDVFFFPEAMQGVGLRSPAFATARGLRVGDRGERLRELYDDPSGTYDDVWDYTDPEDPSELHLIRFQLVDGWVRSIFVGWVLD